MPRLTTIATATLTAALLLTGCGSSSDTASNGEKPAQQQSVTATATAKDVPPPIGPQEKKCKQQTNAFTGPVADEWGADQVMDAYCELVDFNAQNQITGLVEKKFAEQTLRDYAFLEKYLTPKTVELFRKEVAAGLEGFKKSRDGKRLQWPGILTLTSFEFLDPYTFVKGGPYAFGFYASPAAVKTDQVTKPDGGTTRALTFSFAIDIHAYMVDKKGDPHSQKMSKKVTFRVVPTKSDERDWLIQDWTMDSLEYGKVKPYKAPKN